MVAAAVVFENCRIGMWDKSRRLHYHYSHRNRQIYAQPAAAGCALEKLPHQKHFAADSRTNSFEAVDVLTG